jgi:ABC-type glycerol-3-phosphate transport system substrate-binding protein
MIDTYNKSQKGIIVRGAFQGNEEDLYLKLNSQENLFSFNSNLLFVNQHILRISGTWREPDPATWDEIFTLARKIRDYTSGKWSIFIPMETLSHFISFVQSFSGMPLFEQQRLVVNSEDAIRAMSTLQEFVYTHDFMPPKITMSEGEQIFLSGKLGIMMAPI